MPVASEIAVAPKFLRWVTGIVVSTAVVLYPVFVHTSLTAHEGRPAAGRLYWLLVPFGLSAWIALRSPASTTSRPMPHPLVAPSLALLLLGAALALDVLEPLLLVPAVVNGSLLVAFLPTLWSETPLIERFARRQHPGLTAEERSWCRSWTVAWSCFFAFNIIVAAVLALTRQLRAWTLYNGFISYVLMGCLFAGEYTVRKYRFGRYASHPIDRLLRRLSPRQRGHRERP